MRYVKSIDAYPEGEVPGLFYTVRRPGDPVNLVVHDTDSGVDKVIGAGKLSLLTDVYGFQHHVTYTGTGVVVNNEKTIQLHQYVQSVGMFSGSSVLDLANSDICVLQTGGRADTSGVVGHSNLAINTGRDLIHIGGIKGSVVVRQYGFTDGAAAFNLYNLFGELCRECGFNIMAYSTIRLYSRVGKITVAIIRLRHDAEADRYFMKMYLDVTRRET